MIAIGIDPGTHTGFAAYDTAREELIEVKTLRIDEALARTLEYCNASRELGAEIYVIFEDARQRVWFGNNARAKQQGAGSIKRDSSIWEDFLKAHNIRHWAKPPTKGTTKWTRQRFAKLTGWKAMTSEHARDAALLVWGL